MKAILGIQRTITLYGQLLDDLRMEDWGRLFTDDAVWAMPGFTFAGREEIVHGVRAMEPDTPGLAKHIAFNPVIHFERDDLALAWTDLLFLTRETAEGAWTTTIAGRYYDELVDQGGDWRFRKRVCDFLPDQPPAVPFERSPRV